MRSGGIVGQNSPRPGDGVSWVVERPGQKARVHGARGGEEVQGWIIELQRARRFQVLEGRVGMDSGGWSDGLHGVGQVDVAGEEVVLGRLHVREGRARVDR